MKNEYNYKGFTIRRTETTLAQNNKPLFEIYGGGLFREYLKEAGKRPWITSVKQAKEFITDYIEYQLI